jgi:aspartyl-tRNA(Asn)/glutamyl-tRNA(Gln) amidotransferase subunit A
MLRAETATFHAARLADRGECISRKTRLAVEAFSLLPAVYYLQGLRALKLLRRELEGLFDSCDVLVMPTAPTPAPEGIDSTGDASLLSPWTLVGFPAATVPCGLSPSGLPIGLQIVGRLGCDSTVLDAAEFAERILGRVSLPNEIRSAQGPADHKTHC